MSFTMGSDPEFMLMRDGRYYSAIEIVPGDKDHRYQIGQHEYYFDNVLAECSIFPGSDKQDTIYQFRDCLQKYANLIKPYTLVAQAAQEYPHNELRHQKAKEAGCDPERCAYALQMLKPKTNLFAHNAMRSAGGHIHLGTSLAKTMYGAEFIVRMMDLFIGLPSIYIDHDLTARQRKTLYGRAGRYRLPKHGVEYRTLGNFWLSSPKLVGLIYDLCKFILQFVEQDEHLKLWTVDFNKLNDDHAREQPEFRAADCHHCHGYDVATLRNAIDTMDRKQGKSFMKMIFDILPVELTESLKTAAQPIKYDLYKEWCIKT